MSENETQSLALTIIEQVKACLYDIKDDSYEIHSVQVERNWLALSVKPVDRFSLTINFNTGATLLVSMHIPRKVQS